MGIHLSDHRVREIFALATSGKNNIEELDEEGFKKAFEYVQ